MRARLAAAAVRSRLDAFKEDVTRAVREARDHIGRLRRIKTPGIVAGKRLDLNDRDTPLRLLACDRLSARVGAGKVERIRQVRRVQDDAGSIDELPSFDVGRATGATTGASIMTAAGVAIGNVVIVGRLRVPTWGGRIITDG